MQKKVERDNLRKQKEEERRMAIQKKALEAKLVKEKERQALKEAKRLKGIFTTPLAHILKY